MSLFLSSLLSRARFIREKKNLDRFLEAAVRPPPREEEERRRNKRRFAKGCASNKNSLSSRKRTTTRERMITALSRTRRNFKDDYTFLF